jgi:tetratricopeptide (TPR) repeat protein
MTGKFKVAVLTMISIFCVMTYLQIPLYSTSSSVRGIVTDKANGNPLAKVKIIILSQRNKTLKYEIKTDKKGTFYKGGLRNGLYQLTVEKEGYIPARTTLRLMAGKTREYNAKLEVLKVKSSVQAIDLVKSARKLIAAGKLDEAIARVTKAIEKEPGSFILYYNRALVYEKKGDKVNALKDFEKSLESKPDFILSLASAANIHAKNGAFEKAAKFYKKAFTLGITDTVALYNYGACLINLGNSNEAKTVFEKLVSIDPDYADAYYQLGIVYLGLNDNAKAKEFLTKFLELDPENANASVAKEILKTI